MGVSWGDLTGGAGGFGGDAKGLPVGEREEYRGMAVWIESSSW